MFSYGEDYDLSEPYHPQVWLRTSDDDMINNGTLIMINEGGLRIKYEKEGEKQILDS